ncbi:MAG: HAD family hydrolase [Acidimicrobiales bacterium]
MLEPAGEVADVYGRRVVSLMESKVEDRETPVLAALLLDLDGTLVDSVLLHAVAWWRAFDEAGIQVSTATIQPLIGMGGPELLQRVIGHDDPGLRKAHGRFFEPMRSWVRPLPGAAELLARAGQEGIRRYVVTSSNPADAEALIALLPDDAIDGVVHGDEVASTKPAPDLYQLALARWNLEPDTTVAVGDSEWDVRAGGRAGVRSLGLLTGGTPAQTLFEAGAVAVFPSCRELVRAWAGRHR